MNKIIFAAVTLLLANTVALAQETTSAAAVTGTEPRPVLLPDFCAQAQKSMANTSLDVINEIHTERPNFTKSKPSMQPLTAHQMIDYQPVTVSGVEQLFPVVISCKLKTADILNQVYGEGSAGEERDCRHLLDKNVQQAAAELGAAELTHKLADIILDEDEVTRMGPMWLNPWPWQSAYVDGNNKLHFRGKALLVPFSVFIPMPDRFKGTHYCHLPTPQYIAAVMAGKILPGSLVE